MLQFSDIDYREACLMDPDYFWICLIWNGITAAVPKQLPAYQSHLLHVLGITVGWEDVSGCSLKKWCGEQVPGMQGLNLC